MFSGYKEMFLLADKRKVGKIHQEIFLLIAFSFSFSQKFGYFIFP